MCMCHNTLTELICLLIIVFGHNLSDGLLTSTQNNESLNTSSTALSFKLTVGRK